MQSLRLAIPRPCAVACTVPSNLLLRRRPSSRFKRLDPPPNSTRMTQTSYALVTGASRGLGKYFARALAARQQNLVLVARDTDRLAKVSAELEKTYGIRAETVALDLASSGAGGRLAQQMNERGLKIDLVVNNAGFGD